MLPKAARAAPGVKDRGAPRQHSDLVVASGFKGHHSVEERFGLIQPPMIRQHARPIQQRVAARTPFEPKFRQSLDGASVDFVLALPAPSERQDDGKVDTASPKGLAVADRRRDGVGLFEVLDGDVELPQVAKGCPERDPRADLVGGGVGGMGRNEGGLARGNRVLKAARQHEESSLASEDRCSSPGWRLDRDEPYRLVDRRDRSGSSPSPQR